MERGWASAWASVQPKLKAADLLPFAMKSGWASVWASAQAIKQKLECYKNHNFWNGKRLSLGLSLGSTEAQINGFVFIGNENNWGFGLSFGSGDKPNSWKSNSITKWMSSHHRGRVNFRDPLSTGSPGASWASCGLFWHPGALLRLLGVPGAFFGVLRLSWGCLGLPRPPRAYFGFLGPFWPFRKGSKSPLWILYFWIKKQDRWIFNEFGAVVWAALKIHRLFTILFAVLFAVLFFRSKNTEFTAWIWSAWGVPKTGPGSQNKPAEAQEAPGGNDDVWVDVESVERQLRT